jgi:hypothetical protein
MRKRTRATGCGIKPRSRARDVAESDTASDADDGWGTVRESIDAPISRPLSPVGEGLAVRTSQGPTPSVQFIASVPRPRLVRSNRMLLVAPRIVHASSSHCTRRHYMHQHSSHSIGTLTNGLTADSSRCAMQRAQGVAVGTEDDARPAQRPTRPSRLPRNAKAAAAIAISAHVEDHNV